VSEITGNHLSDDDLEAYSLNRLSAAASAPLEVHLLECARCRDRQVRWGEYTRAVRAACKELETPLRTRTAGDPVE